MKKLAFIFILLFGVCLFTQSILANETPKLSETDRIRLSEAFRLSDKFAEKVWKGWNKAPFALLLVTSEYEFLLRHPSPTPDFTEIGYDKSLKSKIFWRKKIFDQRMLATFPAVNGVSTIVVGQAENTSFKTSALWTVVILHEHFHQLQDSNPRVNQEVVALDLAGEDKTGMWMLNYPFPYQDKKINEDFSNLSKQLAKTLEISDKKSFQPELETYLKMRKQFNSTLSEKDCKYLSFQLWKEGTARYTEIQIAKLASQNYQPNKDFTNLKDFSPYREVAAHWEKNIVNSLKNISLAKSKREVVYSFGAAEAMLLDKAKIKWKHRYFKEMFYLDKYFEQKN